MKKIKIAVDVMGGDNAPLVPIKASVAFAKDNPNTEFHLYGDEEIINKNIPSELINKNIFIINAKEKLDSGVSDVSFLMRKENDIPLFKMMKDSENYDAIVSAGPTQAVVAGGHFLVGRLPKIRRIAFAPILTNFDGVNKLLLDAGANITLTAEQLNDLAIVGTAFAKTLFSSKNPTIGLLNVGAEDTKGREVERETHKLLSLNNKINFIGNVEPELAFGGDVEIILADGFAGNIFLKTLEGFYAALRNSLKGYVFKGLGGAIAYLSLKGKIKKLNKKMSPKKVGGAAVLGCKKVVVKVHGSSDERTFYNGIGLSHKLCVGNVIENLVNTLEDEKNY